MYDVCFTLKHVVRNLQQDFPSVLDSPPPPSDVLVTQGFCIKTLQYWMVRFQAPLPTISLFSSIISQLLGFHYNFFGLVFTEAEL
jgi:hypothetical protein